MSRASLLTASALLLAPTALLAPEARAAGPLEAATALAADHGLAAPDMAVSCTPMGRVLELASALPLPPMMRMQLSEEPSGRLMMSLLDPAQAKARGFDLEGGVTMLMWEREQKSHAVSVPFSGAAVQVQELLDQLGPNQAGDDGRSWSTLSKGGEDLWVLEEGALVMQPDGAPAGTWERPALLEGLPEVDGCLVYASPDDLPGKDGPSEVDLAMFLPLSGGAPMLVRFALPQAAPEVFSSARRGPVGGNSLEAPSVVMTVGVPLFELVELIADEAKIDPADLEFVRSKVTLEPGMTLAFFGKPDAMDVAAVVPVTDGGGQPIKTRRLVRLIYKGMKREGMAVTREGKDSFTALVGDRTIYLRAAPGAVVAGTNGLAVQQAAFGMGEPWVSPELAAHAAEWPVAVGGGQSMGPQGSVSVLMGLRSSQGYWEMATEVKVDDPTGQLGRAMAAGMGMAMMAAGPKFQEMQLRAKRAEVPGYVDAIYTAQLAQEASFDQGYVAAPPSPRDPEALDAEEVAWTGGAAWEQLAFAPSEDVRGTYWVEVSEDGKSFVVHGMIDADADGVPARWSRTLGGELVQHTPKEVY